MKQSNKTLLLSLGTVTMTMAPIATVVACGEEAAAVVTLNSFSAGINNGDFKGLVRSKDAGVITNHEVIDEIKKKSNFSKLSRLSQARFVSQNVSLTVDADTPTSLVISLNKSLTGETEVRKIIVTGFGAEDTVKPTAEFTSIELGGGEFITEDTVGSAYSVTLAKGSDTTLAEIEALFTVMDETDEEEPIITWALTGGSFDAEVAATLLYTGTYTDIAGNAGEPIVVTITTISNISTVDKPTLSDLTATVGDDLSNHFPIEKAGYTLEIYYNGGLVTDVSSALVGSYLARYTLEDKYTWTDGTTEVVDITIGVRAATSGKTDVTAPTLTNTTATVGDNLTSQFPSAPTGSTRVITKGGVASTDEATSTAGTYTATYSLDDTATHQWTGGSTTNVTLMITVSAPTGKTDVTAPTLVNTTATVGDDLTSQFPAAPTGSTRAITKGGVASTDEATSTAGTYTATYSLDDTATHQWTGGSITNVTLMITVSAAANIIAPSMDAVTVGLTNAAADIMGAGPYTLALVAAFDTATAAEILAAFSATDAVTGTASLITSAWSETSAGVAAIGAVTFTAADVWTVTITATDNVDSNLTTVVTLTVTVS